MRNGPFTARESESEKGKNAFQSDAYRKPVHSARMLGGGGGGRGVVQGRGHLVDCQGVDRVPPRRYGYLKSSRAV